MAANSRSARPGVEKAPICTPDEPPTDARREAFVKGLETQYRLDYAYYAGTEPMQYGGQKVQPLALPREVLEKFYVRNAQRLIGVK